ncbi:tetratricopeptide repeat protein [Thiococcus pfennigii]|uniref:tetratricopeptide repeat protein n=1 Tax=Thiococcus pfennigii TaxID=1057 RepID=UPI001905EB97|nr:tetratricopeptide repeat protein [Thiococcus pfennigii]
MGELLELAVYNPAILSDQAFLNGFVARQALAERLLQRLGETTADGLATHHLILGQRGMGKTSLLRRLALGVRDDPRLAAVLLPLRFREEQYNVHNLRVFWLNCLDALGDWLEQRGEVSKAAALDRDVARLGPGVGQDAPDADPEGDAALETFTRWTRAEGRRPLLLLDNLDIILNGLARQQWRLRKELQRPGGILVVGAATGWLEATEAPGSAFYDFFQITLLEPLSADEMLTCLRRLAAQRGEPGRAVLQLLATDPGRIRALHDLTGGNPRTLTLLYLLLETDTGGDALTDLDRLLDQVSVLYKARIEDLAPQSRAVLDAVALAWDPVLAAEVARASGLETKTVSAQLTRLERDGILQKVSVSRSHRDAFQLAERFFNIWYLMRHGPRRQRVRLRWLSAFLRGFYSPVQLRERARSLLSGAEGAGLERGQYLVALSDAEDEPAWRRALALQAEREIAADLARSGKRLADIGDLSDLPRPETAEDWDLHGLLLRGQLGRPDEAEAAYRTAVRLDPQYGSAWRHLGTLLSAQGRYEEAEAALRTAIGCGSGWWAWIDLAGLLLRTNRLAEVESVYRDALDRNPEDPLAWGALGNLLAQDPGRAPDAEAVLRRATGLDPANPYHPKNLGQLLMQSGRLDDAEVVLRGAVRQHPSAPTWGTLGYLLLYFREQLDEAREAYLKARDLDPTDVTVVSNLLAIALLNDDAEPVADTDFNAIIGRHPASGANLLRALRGLVRNDLPAAADGFAAALSDPDGEALTLYQGFVLLLLREAARRGHGDALLAALRARGIGDTHWPLVAAYDAYLHGEARLADANPEVRIAARRIFDWLDAPRRGGAGDGRPGPTRRAGAPRQPPRQAGQRPPAGNPEQAR